MPAILAVLRVCMQLASTIQNIAILHPQHVARTRTSKLLGLGLIMVGRKSKQLGASSKCSAITILHPQRVARTLTSKLLGLGLIMAARPCTGRSSTTSTTCVKWQRSAAPGGNRRQLGRTWTVAYPAASRSSVSRERKGNRPTAKGRKRAKRGR